jgi:hypothetical protein
MNRSDSSWLPAKPFGRESIDEALASTDRVAMIGLVIANLVPLLLSLLFGWDVGDVALFYWWENIVTGIYAALRILLAAGHRSAGSTVAIAGAAGKAGLIPFFLFHYFFFCFVHLMFLRVFFRSETLMNESPLINSASEVAEILPQAGLIGILALLISHGLSFVRNYVQGGEYKVAIPPLEMFRPYGRIVLLHVCILAGGLTIQLLGSPWPMLVLLIIGKTVLDLASHVVVHSFDRHGLLVLANWRERIGHGQNRHDNGKK